MDRFVFLAAIANISRLIMQEKQNSFEMSERQCSVVIGLLILRTHYRVHCFFRAGLVLPHQMETRERKDAMRQARWFSNVVGETLDCV